MLIDELLNYLFDSQPHLIRDLLATWLADSRRFTSFVNTFRDKIRKKIRVTQDAESIFDLRLELETAYLLLKESRLSLVYEPQMSEKIRAPDFAVTFTTSFTFMVEVTRLRAEQKSALAESQEETLSTQSSNAGERLADVVCSKFGQLVPAQSNVLIIGTEAMQPTPNDLRTVMLRIQQRAEGNDLAYLQRYRFRDRADFFRHLQRLSEILVRRTDLQTAQPTVAWVNPQARHPLTSKVRTVLYRSQTV